MTEPVIAADGLTYERTAIRSWLQETTISPTVSWWPYLELARLLEIDPLDGGQAFSLSRAP